MWHFSSVSVMSEWPVTPTKCWLSVFCSFTLRLVKCVKKLLSGLVCECDSRFVEIGGNVCKQRIPVLNNDGSIEALPLDGSAGRAYGEAVGLGRLLEPANEEAVACCFAVVAGIADVEQYVLVLQEELVDDGEERETHVGIFGCGFAVGLGKAELPRLASADGLFLEEPHFVSQSVCRVEYVLLALYLNFVGSNLVYAVDLKRLHTVADVVC